MRRKGEKENEVKWAVNQCAAPAGFVYLCRFVCGPPNFFSSSRMRYCLPGWLGSCSGLTRSEVLRRH